MFKSKTSTRKAILRYIALAVPQLIAQIVLSELSYVLLHIGAEQTIARAIVYAIVMIVLFVFSFVIQQRWVFADKKETNSNQ